MILEGIVTTLDGSGTLNIAPMGPKVDPDFRRLVLRPFRTSTTYRNLRESGEGVFHVVDDVLLLARSTIERVTDAPTRPAIAIRGQVLLECCRSYEFRVLAVDESEERSIFVAESLCEAKTKDFFGFNRAKHAVLETAILASRIDFLDVIGLATELEKFRTVVAKTGGSREAEAYTLLENHIRRVIQSRGLSLEASPE